MSPSPLANGVVTVIIVMAMDISGNLDTATDIMATGIGCDMRSTTIRVIRITATAAMAIARVATTAMEITITGAGAEITHRVMSMMVSCPLKRPPNGTG
jgi:hypothetical protein